MVVSSDSAAAHGRVPNVPGLAECPANDIPHAIIHYTSQPETNAAQTRGEKARASSCSLSCGGETDV